MDSICTNVMHNETDCAIAFRAGYRSGERMPWDEWCNECKKNHDNRYNPKHPRHRELLLQCCTYGDHK